MPRHRRPAIAATLVAGIVSFAAVDASAAGMRFQNCTDESILLHGFHSVDTINRISWTTRRVEPGEKGYAGCLGDVCRIGVGPVQALEILPYWYSEDHCLIHTGRRYEAYLPGGPLCNQHCK